jgi:hypothetical protein
MERSLRRVNNRSRGMGAENGPSRKGREPKLGPFAARSGVHRRDSVYSTSPQAKAAFVQVGHCNWDCKENLVSDSRGKNSDLALCRIPK